MHKPESQSESAREEQGEIALDGVRYAALEEAGSLWRVGSLAPDWRADLVGLGRNPAARALDELKGRGIFLSNAQKPRTAIMCCGLGSAWPGMGRELYDNFPAARQAMERLAAFADWDLLALMDEKDPERVNATRTQIPYLFMLEYAQWAQLLSLGFKPDLICGHSLGELVALCLAGVYSPEAAWHLLDTRASHMASLEKSAGDKSGMLAVSGDRDIITKTLAEHPELHISNCNTARQYVLSGPRPILTEARKKLRRLRVPAFLLNINLAFHNPAMRILRNISFRRLNSLEMRAPAIPLLSCVTANLYPDRQPDICRYITDLDENTVDWPESVNFILKQNINHFIELGPQATLCGLVQDIAPDTYCMAASHKGHETRAMQELCAQLYSLGCLPHAALLRQMAERKNYYPPLLGHLPDLALADNGQTKLNPDSEEAVILQILAEATGRAITELTQNLDLRYDLALRSSRFPWLVQEAEQRLGHSIPMENLLRITTVGDLLHFFTGESEAESQPAARVDDPLQLPSPFLGQALGIFDGTLALREKRLEPCLLDLKKQSPFSHRGLIALCVFDKEILPQLCSGLAALNLSMLIPARLLEKRQIPSGSNQLLPLNIDEDSTPGGALEALRKVREKYGDIEGLLFAPPSHSEENGPGNGQTATFDDSFFSGLMDALLEQKQKPWVCGLLRMRCKADVQKLPEAFERLGASFQELVSRGCLKGGFVHKSILWLDRRKNPLLQNQFEAGNLLLQNLLYCHANLTFWLPLSFYGQPCMKYCPALLWPENIRQLPPAPEKSLAGSFAGESQYSFFAAPLLARHGKAAKPLAVPNPGASARLPLGEMLANMLLGARLLAPWLEPLGLSDVRIRNLPDLYAGVSREMRQEARASQWLKLDGAWSGLCKSRLLLREITPNGRHINEWQAIASAVCLLAAGINADLPALLVEDAHVKAEPVPEKLLKRLYERLAYEQPWRLLRKARVQIPASSKTDSDNISCVARLRLPNRIADHDDWNYNYLVYLVEGIYQASLLTLTMTLAAGEDTAAVLDQWHCASIGYMRFNPYLAKKAANPELVLECSWHTNDYMRFDCLIKDAGAPVLSCLHLEFLKNGPPQPGLEFFQAILA